MCAVLSLSFEVGLEIITAAVLFVGVVIQGDFELHLLLISIDVRVEET